MLQFWVACVWSALNLPLVPDSHPRVYVTADQLGALRQKVQHPANIDLYTNLKGYYAQNYPIAAAFVYLIEGDEAMGQWAISETLPELAASTSSNRFEDPIHWGACVYDWCYPLLTAQNKTDFIAEFVRIASVSPTGYPVPTSLSEFVGLTNEGSIMTGQLPAGLAIYDEQQTMYDAAIAGILGPLRISRNWYFPAHTHHQGDSYYSRYCYDIAGATLLKVIGADNVYSTEMQFMPYGTMYNLLADMKQFPRGDTYDYTGLYGMKRESFLLTATYYNDPYLLDLHDWWPRWFDPQRQVLQLILIDPDAERRPLSELPLTKYFPEPVGEMTARTGWNLGLTGPEHDALIFMRAGGAFFTNHQRRDMGTFQIYYRGMLAAESGVYSSGDTWYGTDHWRDYYHQTLAHNGLLIYDPGEVLTGLDDRSVNEGGQMNPNNSAAPRNHTFWSQFQLGEVIGHDFGPSTQTPEYSYIAGDITDSYTNKVSAVQRSMVALNYFDSTYPASLIVFDRVVSTNASFEKTWLLHSVQEPQINGTTYTITNNQGNNDGKLVGHCLLPVSPQFTKIGGSGYEFWVEQVNHNYAVEIPTDRDTGRWRIEINPPTAQAQDFFLNAMTVMDGQTAAPPPPIAVSNPADTVAGVQLFDRAVVFAKTPGLTGAQFSLAGSGAYKVLVCGLAGGTWQVAQGGAVLAASVIVDAEQACLYFNAQAQDGQISLTRLAPAVMVNHDNRAEAAVVVAGEPFHSSTIGFTGTGLVSSPEYNDPIDAWHRFVPAVSGRYRLSLMGSCFDTTLAVYEGTSTTVLAVNDDSELAGIYSQMSVLDLDLTAGVEYQVRVAGYQQGYGNYLLSITRLDPGSECDFNSDLVIDELDFGFLTGQWLTVDPIGHPLSDKSPDLNKDAVVNLADVSYLADYWKQSLLQMPDLSYSCGVTDAVGSSLTWSHHVRAGDNGILLVGLSVEDTRASDMDVAQITFAGLPMTPVPDSDLLVGTSYLLSTQWFYLLSPPAGTASVDITFAGTISEAIGIGASACDILQAAPSPAVVAQATTGDTVSLDITTPVDFCLLVDLAACGNPGQFEHVSPSGSYIGANQSAGNSSAASSYSSIPTYGAQQVLWQHDNANRLGLSAVVLEPQAVALEEIASHAVQNVTSNTISWTHEITKEDMALVVCVVAEDQRASDLAIQSATFGGVPMTPIADTEILEGTSYLLYGNAYCVLDPPVGISTIAFEFAGDISRLCGTAVSRNGLQMQAPTATIAESTSVSAPLESCVSLATNSWVVNFAGCGNVGTFEQTSPALTELVDVSTDNSSMSCSTGVVGAGTACAGCTHSNPNRLINIVIAME